MLLAERSQATAAVPAAVIATRSGASALVGPLAEGDGGQTIAVAAAEALAATEARQPTAADIARERKRERDRNRPRSGKKVRLRDRDRKRTRQHDPLRSSRLGSGMLLLEATRSHPKEPPAKVARLDDDDQRAAHIGRGQEDGGAGAGAGGGGGDDDDDDDEDGGDSSSDGGSANADESAS